MCIDHVLIWSRWCLMPRWLPDAFCSMALFCYFVSLFKRYPAEFLKYISHVNFITWTSNRSCSTWLESGVFVLERPHSYPPNARNNQNMGGLKSFKERVSFSVVGSTTVQMLYRYLGKAANQAGPANVVRPLVEDKLLTIEAAGNRS